MSNHPLSLCNVVMIFNNPKMGIYSAYVRAKDHQSQVEEYVKREKEKLEDNKFDRELAKYYRQGFLKPGCS